ncbi:hypothetical protein I5I84_00520 [Pseudomonas aeruginosa]|nr:hypothetical protein [Pseudomonas aeruginosa]
MVEFNPWLFNGKEQLAAQILSRLHSALPNESPQQRETGKFARQTL